jgi:DNA-binding NtrC family response regulator
LRSQVERIAPHFRIALIRGESGAGKELVARAIHALSPAAGGPFIVANVARLVESLDGGEASHMKPTPIAASLFDSAQGGTLYLRGVDDLSFRLQGALFRFLRDYEERRAAPQSSGFDRADTRRAETRILAACDRDLRTLSAIGQFHQELYGHLSTVEIFVPPLCRRIEDIPTLAEWLLRRIADESGRSVKRFAAETLAQMQMRLWPDNLREMQRVVARAAALAEGATIEPRHLLALVDPAATPAIKIDLLHDVVQHHVLDVLTRCGGNKLRAAELLGVSRSTLYRMLDTGRLQFAQ